MSFAHHRSFWRSLPRLAALLLLTLASSAFAQEESDPPGRVAHVSARQGGVVFAPQGEEEWNELPHNRPLTAGDRLWSDRGARAELQLGTATLHLDGQSHLGISDLDEDGAQFILQQGALHARVRELAQGENFEIDTPNLALRALQPGDYRVDVDPRSGETRVVVASGSAVLYGEGGQAVHLRAGQQGTFGGRTLAAVNAQRVGQDDFGAWAAERNRAEDQAQASRYLPRGVVGASQLDQHGTWSQHADYGTVWYPRVVAQDWAPYRYGHWSWIDPWGWTWIDDAPWGFAPFHYGRWAMVGSRWAWVPGRMAPRPVYSPALVVFLGDGGSGINLSLGAGPGVGWYPLAPGEAWWPWYRSSPRYVTRANAHIDLRAHPRDGRNHAWRQRPFAITAMREDDFRRGRPVHRQWERLEPRRLDGARVGAAPQRPERQRERERDRDGGRDGGRDRDRDARVQPRLQASPPTAQPRDFGRGEVPPAVREQIRAQREQDRLQRGAERDAREQVREAQQPRRQDDPRWQQERVYREQRESAGNFRRGGRDDDHRGERAERGDRGNRPDWSQRGDRGDRGGRGERGGRGDEDRGRSFRN